MRISLTMDNPKSWYWHHALVLARTLQENGHSLGRYGGLAPEDFRGDLAFYLSYESIVPPEDLARHTQNLVVHSSALPKGRGWAPLTWQILEGASTITNTLFEMTAKVDAGRIMAQNVMEFDGYELLPELHAKQGAAINALVLEYVTRIQNAEHLPMMTRAGFEQTGEPTYYRRRKPEDSRLDPDKTIGEQFNLLRVVDNEKYPAFFEMDGHRYVVRIEKG